MKHSLSPKLKPSHLVVLDALSLLRRIGVEDPTTEEITEVARECGHTSYGIQNVERALLTLRKRRARVKLVDEDSSPRRWRLS